MTAAACEWCGSSERSPRAFVRRDGTPVVMCSERSNECLRERLRQDGVLLLDTPEEVPS